MNFPERAPLRRLLAASICAGFALGSNVGAAPLQADIPAHWTPGDHRAVAALFRAMDAKHKATPRLLASTLPVTSCADDGTPGTLRSVVSGAGDGDVVDLSGLACGPITLTGGVIPIYADTLSIQGRSALDTIISGNVTDRVFLDYGYTSLTLRDLTVRDGFNQVPGYKIAAGACIASNAAVTLDHATVTNCKAIGEGAYGGGILSPGLYMYTSTLSDNTAQGSLLTTLTASYGGGAFAYRGSAAVYDSTISGNRAVGDPAGMFGTYDTGAGLFVDNGGLASRSTISNNYTDGTGGGIATHDDFLVSDSTISGNTAKKKGGGGIFARVFRDLTISSSTIVNNTAAKGGGVYLAGHAGGGVMQSTIVANNHATITGDDVSSQYGVVFTGANDLVMTSTMATLPPATLSADPTLQPLADNGGPTQTHALAPLSPARDAGNNAAGLTVDQRGYTRVFGTSADIGAFEYAPDFIFADDFE
jgi:Right handed beta helix region